jgi:putative membrane protein
MGKVSAMNVFSAKSMLSAAEQQQVTEAIAQVERNTDAELVTVLARRADNYIYIAIFYAAAVALLTPAAIAFSPFWLGMWEVLCAQWIVFIALALILQWPPVLARIIPRSIKRWRAANLARRQFLEQNLHHTHAHTGILIFVSEVERYVEIIADRGIDMHVDQAEWQTIVDDFTAHVKRGEILPGFLHCVRSCGELLQRHVPATSHKNELPDHMVVINN